MVRSSRFQGDRRGVREEVDIVIDGKVSKLDKWKYEDTLNILARNAIFTLGTSAFYVWVDRLAVALRCVNVKSLPLRDKIDKERKKMNDCYNQDMNYLEKIQPHEIRRSIMEDSVRQKHYENFLDFLLDLATNAGFTLYLESIDESASLRG